MQAGLCSKRSINQQKDWQRIEFEVLRLDRGHAFLSLVPNSAEMRYIPFSALQPVPAEQQHAQSIALYGGALKLKSGGNAARISVGLDCVRG